MNEQREERRREVLTENDAEKVAKKVLEQMEEQFKLKAGTTFINIVWNAVLIVAGALIMWFYRTPGGHGGGP